MKTFIGREQELAVLKKEYRRDSSFVVMYGRRRVGKTRLIKEFIKDKKALYFLASQETELLNRQRFASELAAFTNNSVYASAQFDDWRPLFQAIAEHLPDEKKILVIDELPYLSQVNAAFSSILQFAWDEILQYSNTMLILCGSSIGMMESTALAYTSPLYGRRTAQIKLKPLSFLDLHRAFPQRSYASLVELYAVTAGVPKYLEFFENSSNLIATIEENILSTSGFLYEEPKFLLEQEVRDPVNYLSIMRVIAQGNRKISEITRALGKKHGEVTPYLKTLANLGYIERRVPFNEKKPESSKRGLYYLADSFIEFWFRYVAPYVGDLEMGNRKPSLERIAATFNSNFVPFIFEFVCREVFADLCLQGKINFTPSRIGAYWNTKSSIEIDVCAIDNAAQKIFLGECKYLERKVVGIEAYRSLSKKSALLKAEKDSEEEKAPLFGLFSKSGFSKELIEFARSSENLTLINEDQIV